MGKQKVKLMCDGLFEFEVMGVQEYNELLEQQDCKVYIVYIRTVSYYILYISNIKLSTLM